MEAKETTRKERRRAATNGTPVRKVTVTNVKMPFWSMVGFQVKWVIASIPALIVLLVLLFLLAAVLSMLFGGAILGLEELFGGY